ncbi:MAG: transposase [bacterium]|nr:transposase [bacterium]
MKLTVQSLLRRDFASYARFRRLPPHIHKAARSIIRCRTAALGGHVMGCSAGHIAGVWYNSCRHRACPQCTKLQIDRWLQGWRERLLPCDHYHVVFTIPHELLDLWQLNRKRLTDHLFRASRDTLFELLADDRYLGGTPGVVAALHTWGRTLTLHPHVHCLVTGGGHSSGGAWKPARGGYLLPVRVVKAVFRGKFMALLRSDLERDRLTLPAETSETTLSNLLRRLYEKNWNVRLQERYAHGHGVIEYLARYVRGGPIRNRRLVGASPTGTTFSYLDHRDGRNKQLTLTPDEFLRRLFVHVPEPRSHVVRLYGLYGRTQRDVCEACRRELPSPQASRLRPRDSEAENPQHRACRICNRPVAPISEIRPSTPGQRRLPLPNLLKVP